jgi:hypothetical protein
MHHHFNVDTKKLVRFCDYLKDDFHHGRQLKKNDTVRFDGKLYFIAGLSEQVCLRSVNELNAVNALDRLSLSYVKKFEIVRVDELGRITNIEKLE